MKLIPLPVLHFPFALYWRIVSKDSPILSSSLLSSLLSSPLLSSLLFNLKNGMLPIRIYLPFDVTIIQDTTGKKLMFDVCVEVVKKSRKKRTKMSIF
jgi:hypothetical protein